MIYVKNTNNSQIKDTRVMRQNYSFPTTREINLYLNIGINPLNFYRRVTLLKYAYTANPKTYQQLIFSLNLAIQMRYHSKCNHYLTSVLPIASLMCLPYAHAC